jgi:hypothetical protein
VLLCPPQNPHAARTRSRAAAVGSQQLAAWSTARPSALPYTPTVHANFVGHITQYFSCPFSVGHIATEIPSYDVTNYQWVHATSLTSLSLPLVCPRGHLHSSNWLLELAQHCHMTLNQHYVVPLVMLRCLTRFSSRTAPHCRVRNFSDASPFSFTIPPTPFSSFPCFFVLSSGALSYAHIVFRPTIF